MFQVKITDLGRKKVTVTEDMEVVNFNNLLSMVLPHLVSSDIHFVVNYGSGYVYAGFRSVGKIEVTPI
ncbi:hypothetical protein J32TS6_05290 [Virgibacillus pantothenticus]|uniref:hypothetical protein n=1 Tax=Virgibacillus TaxID=84406 RepID=UPI00090C6E86|nr:MULTISPECIES: hypothetical protein [Virgibacillus]API93985.1 hypothetical protein BKP57_20435 [Virgibacillus sp. 6R]MBS7427464.1 hypothetical protein [Virgibacillus sp. 19R1-5]GIP61974.1 hypothetical protein J32TS6_05290 [Virgibacillus pantothenticus]